MKKDEKERERRRRRKRRDLSARMEDGGEGEKKKRIVKRNKAETHTHKTTLLAKEDRVKTQKFFKTFF